MSDIRTVPAAPHLVAELEAIASEELRDILDYWPRLDAGQACRLRRYLATELEPGGMLSIDKAREAGQALGRERQEARRVLAAIARRRQAQLVRYAEASRALEATDHA